jgi:predicted enzyme related to lactoylglutathione lyase
MSVKAAVQASDRSYAEEELMAIPIVKMILYVKDTPKVAAFYQRHFGIIVLPNEAEGWREMMGGAGGCNIALHQASSAQKSGAAIKIVFGVADVRRFKGEREKDGLKFGPIHSTEDFEFANAKDPAGNSVQISSRGLR